MHVEKIIKLIPEQEFEFLAVETSVDYQVKKLTGITVFKLILFSMLNTDKLSLRVMESFFKSARFKKFAGIEDVNTRYNSIRDRICNINAEYFSRLFQRIFEIYNKELKEEKAITKIDSTYVSIASKLVDWSLKDGNKKNQYKQLKYSISLKGSLPCHVEIFTEQRFISENLALKKCILNTLHLKGSIIVFDRGLSAREAFELFNEKNILFIGRTNPEYRCKITATTAIVEKQKEGSVTIVKDVKCYLKDKYEKWTESEYRLITGIIDDTGERICLVTNNFDLNPYEIATIYKQRWEIEVFFKFLKQHLNLNHLLSRTENGIKVMLYMTMILAILLLVYKKINKIKGYKIAKLRFEIELDNLLLKEIVIICGGNPKKASYLWNTS
jgi:hypothetical protein